MKCLREIRKILSQSKSIILEDKTPLFARAVLLDFQIKPTHEGFLLFIITGKRLLIREIMRAAKKEHWEDCSNRLIPGLWTTTMCMMHFKDKRSKQLLAKSSKAVLVLKPYSSSLITISSAITVKVCSNTNTVPQIRVNYLV